MACRMTSAGCAAILLAIASLAWFSPSGLGNDFSQRRNRMVDDEIVAAGIKDPRVIRSMRETPRHEFVALNQRENAYYDMALAIGHAQTISPPFVVAYMTEQLLPEPTDNVLEIGTGSGYQAAVLSPLVKEVYTIEIVKPLGERAARTLKRLKYANVHAKVGDGYQGWPEHAPFDKIIVTCSPEKVPAKLVEQLREGGRMIVPVGERYEQTLYLFHKEDGKLKKIALLPTLFVPMTGKAEDGRVAQPDPLHPSINNGGFEEIGAGESESGDHLAARDKAAAAPDNTANAERTARPESTEANEEPSAAAWHYQRQMHLVEAGDAPQGKRYATFSNTEPGRASHALQGLAVDGRKVSELSVSLWVKGQNLQQGPRQDQQPMLAITFYDELRAQTGYTWVGPWQDSFAWRKVTERLRVPPKAREAIVRIGLSGATGDVSFDDIRIEASR